MRWSDDGPMQPEVAAALAAVDATLAGEPADPDYAELAELALILRRDRPVPSDPFPRPWTRRCSAGSPVPRVRAGRAVGGSCTRLGWRRSRWPPASPW